MNLINLILQFFGGFTQEKLLEEQSITSFRTPLFESRKKAVFLEY